MHCHHLYRMRAPTHMRLRSSSNQHRRHRPGVAVTSSLATCPLIFDPEKPAMARLSAISMGGHWLLLVSLLAAMSGSDRLVSSEPVSVKVFDASTCAGPCPGCTKAAAFIAAGAMQWDPRLKATSLDQGALSQETGCWPRIARTTRSRATCARLRWNRVRRCVAEAREARDQTCGLAAPETLVTSEGTWAVSAVRAVVAKVAPSPC